MIKKTTMPHRVRYYFNAGAHRQEDRDWVAQVFSYFSRRTKGQACKVTHLPDFVQGYSEDLDASTAPEMTFLALKQFGGCIAYIQANKSAHNDVSVYISIDDAPFFMIM